MNYGIWDIKGKYWIHQIYNKSNDIFTDTNLNVVFSFLMGCGYYYEKFDKKLIVKIMEQR